MHLFLVLGSVLVSSIVVVAAAQDYMPLTEGVQYEYEFETHQGYRGVVVRYFSGTIDIHGTVTKVLRHSGSFDDGLKQFWSDGSDGDKLFHGSQRTGDPHLFTPPVVRIDAPLLVGKMWSVETRDSDGFLAHVVFEVIAQGDVTVPAGTFSAFTIAETWDVPEGNHPSQLRSWCDANSWTVNRDTNRSVLTFSYATGIGPILEQLGPLRTDRLTAYRTVPVRPATWSAVRQLYR